MNDKITFQITRTSTDLWCDKNKAPCEGARQVIEPIYYMNTNTPIIDDSIPRTTINWLIDLSANDLLSFSTIMDNPIILGHDKTYNRPTLEIYDDYRE